MEEARGDAGLSDVEVVRRVMEAFEAGDIEGQLALLDRDVALTEWPEAPDRRTFHGHAGALEAVASWFDAWASMSVAVDEIEPVGEHVLVRGRFRGVGKGSEVAVEGGAYYLYSVRGGKVARIQFFNDEPSALAAAEKGDA